MDRIQRSHYRLTFSLRFHESTGTVFQELFCDLMGRAYKMDFQKIKPYGSKGDLKCDGYLSSTQNVFQCYAPRELKEGKTLEKIGIDYPGARIHWNDKMKVWTFVHNDHDGLPAAVVQRLQDLKTSEHPVGIETWTLPELLKQLERVSPGDLIDLYGDQPTSTESSTIGFKDLQPVLAVIARQPPNPDPIIKAPSLTKATYNQLSQDTQAYLQIGRRRDRVVQDFFEQWPEPDFADQISETFRRRYSALRNASLSSEQIFYSLMRFAGYDQGPDVAHNAAVLAVIAYFFDRCEIFEDPNGLVFSS